MINEKRQYELNKFLETLNLSCDIEKIDVALTHSSYCYENDLHYTKCNERLEFLGDAVLKLVISNYLYKRFPEYHEGDLSQIRSVVVSDETLNKLARKINLDKYINLGQAEESNGGRNRNATIACAFEAMLGALFLDGKFRETLVFLENLFEEEITFVDKEGLLTNPKAMLQEYFQITSTNLPEYVLTKQEGPPHDRKFYVDVYFENDFLASGMGTTKKSAQKDAAMKACKKLGLIGEREE